MSVTGKLSLALVMQNAQFRSAIRESADLLKVFEGKRDYHYKAAKRDFAHTRKMMNAYQADMMRAGAAAAVALGTFSALTRGIRKTSQAAMQFQFEMRAFGALMGQSTLVTTKLYTSFLETNQALREFLPAEIVSRMKAFTQAGYSTEQAMQGTKAALNAVTAAFGSLDIQKAQELAITLERTFGGGGRTFGTLMDSAVAAANKFPMTVDQITDAMGYAAESAAVWDQDLNSVVATLGVLMPIARSASKTGTAYRNALISLSKPQTLAFLNKHKIALKDQNGQLRDALTIYTEIHKVIQKIRKQDRKDGTTIAEQTIRTVGGVRGGAMFAALDRMPETYAGRGIFSGRKFADSSAASLAMRFDMADAGGEVDRLSDQMRKSAQIIDKEFNASLTRASISIGTALIPTLNGLKIVASRLSKWFSKGLDYISGADSGQAGGLSVALSAATGAVGGGTLASTMGVGALAMSFLGGRADNWMNEWKGSEGFAGLDSVGGLQLDKQKYPIVGRLPALMSKILGVGEVVQPYQPTLGEPKPKGWDSERPWAGMYDKRERPYAELVHKSQATGDVGYYLEREKMQRNIRAGNGRKLGYLDILRGKTRGSQLVLKEGASLSKGIWGLAKSVGLFSGVMFGLTHGIALLEEAINRNSEMLKAKEGKNLASTMSMFKAYLARKASGKHITSDYAMANYGPALPFIVSYENVKKKKGLAGAQTFVDEYTKKWSKAYNLSPEKQLAYLGDYKTSMRGYTMNKQQAENLGISALDRQGVKTTIAMSAASGRGTTLERTMMGTDYKRRGYGTTDSFFTNAGQWAAGVDSFIKDSANGVVSDWTGLDFGGNKQANFRRANAQLKFAKSGGMQAFGIDIPEEFRRDFEWFKGTKSERVQEARIKLESAARTAGSMAGYSYIEPVSPLSEAQLEVTKKLEHVSGRSVEVQTKMLEILTQQLTLQRENAGTKKPLTTSTDSQ